MTTDQVRLFLSIVETGGFTATAESLETTQATVSKQIHALETEMGATLFDRSRRRVSLTEFGRLFLPLARTIRSTYEESLRLAHSQVRENANRLRVASLPILRQYRLNEVIHAYEQSHPTQRILMRECEERELLAALRDNACDIGIAREGMFNRHSYRTAVLAEDELCLFVRKDHPLADRKSISAGDLDASPLMLMPRQTVVCRLALSFFSESGCHPNILQHARIETVIGAVGAGKCGALLMRRVDQVFHTEEIRSIPLRPAVKSRIVAAFSRSGEEIPMAEAFLRHLQGRNAKT